MIGFFKAIPPTKEELAPRCLNIHTFERFNNEIAKIEQAKGSIANHVVKLLAIATGLPKRRIALVNLAVAVDTLFEFMDMNNIYKLVSKKKTEIYEREKSSQLQSQSS